MTASEPVLIVDGDEDTPTLRIHANPLYALYHYLVKNGNAGGGSELDVAAGRAAIARHLLGVHGVWDDWEDPVAAGATVEDAVAGLRQAMTETVDLLASGLRMAETEFVRDLWPERRQRIDMATNTISRSLAPAFDAIVRAQSETLDLVWPETIDAYLVTDCYDWQGGYSHPLTIDVAVHSGLDLCETLIHEATHVADVHTMRLGRQSFRNNLYSVLERRGVNRQQSWNAWHAIIFASSAHQIRRHVDPGHIDFASTRDLYRWFGVPDLPAWWESLMVGRSGEDQFLDAVASAVASGTN